MTGDALSATEAERCVLGSALIDPDAARKASRLHRSHFRTGEHQALFTAIKAIFTAGGYVDHVTVDGWLTARNELGKAGGAGYLIELSQYVPTTANIDAYIAAVEDAALRRAIQIACRDFGNQAADGGKHAVDVLDGLCARLRDLSGHTQNANIDANEAVLRFAAAIGERSGPSAPRRAYTGVPAFDDAIGGLWGGKLIVVGARPGIGKSAFALATALETCRRGHRALYVSLEMDEVELMARVMAHYSGVPVDAIEHTAKLTLEQHQAITAQYMPVSRHRLEINAKARTVADVRHAAFAAHEKGELALIIVDYIGLLRSGQRAESKRVEVGQITRALKTLAQDLKVPVMAVSQLNRQSEAGADRSGRKLTRPPTMAELRESGDVEQDANMVVLLHQPQESKDRDEQFYIEQCTKKGCVYTALMVEKNRQGKKGLYPVAFDGAHMRYIRLGELRYASDGTA